jgi:hypothetical protein
VRMGEAMVADGVLEGRHRSFIHGFDQEADI